MASTQGIDRLRFHGPYRQRSAAPVDGSGGCFGRARPQWRGGARGRAGPTDRRIEWAAVSTVIRRADQRPVGENRAQAASTLASGRAIVGTQYETAPQ